MLPLWPAVAGRQEMYVGERDFGLILKNKKTGGEQAISQNTCHYEARGTHRAHGIYEFHSCTTLSCVGTDVSYKVLMRLTSQHSRTWCLIFDSAQIPGFSSTAAFI